MKTILLAVMSISAMLIFSCGKTYPCKDRQLGLALVGFDSLERSEIKVAAYSGIQRVDSATYKFSATDYFMKGDTAFYNFGALKLSSELIFSNKYDWKITIVNSGIMHKIGDVQYIKNTHKCGGLFSLDCFPCQNPISKLKLDNQDYIPDEFGVVYFKK
jgi:hypothetical protein